MTLHRQKTALAEWAPDLLFADPPLNCFRWNIDELLITDREWLEVSNRLAKRMPINLRCQVAELLIDWCGPLDAPFVEAPQRLEALCRVLWPARFK